MKESIRRGDEGKNRPSVLGLTGGGVGKKVEKPTKERKFAERKRE